MKNLRNFGFLLLLSAILSCEKQDEKNQEEESQTLEEQFDKIKKMSESETCNDESDWDFTAYGNKACGGPVGYIAYPTSIKKEFLKLVEAYAEDQKAYNNRWGIASTCDIPPAPEWVDCVDGSAVLVY
ncbi:MAG: hypothetical protein AB8B72_13530 [Crocinitomicaceae bacterium]